MARIDDLIGRIADKGLRQKLESALADVRRRQRFGLVFEEHVPETTTLFGFPVHVGAMAQRRDDLEGDQLYFVKAANGRKKAEIEPEGGGDLEYAAINDLLVVKRFGDPIFPALTSLGS
jgi:adenine-specific DNA-methyltransferase